MMPTVFDASIVMIVLVVVQKFLESLPEDKSTEYWWAYPASLALLAGIKLIQEKWLSNRTDPAAPGAAAQMSAQLMETRPTWQRILY